MDYEGPQITLSDVDPIRGKGAQLARIHATTGGYLLPDGNAFAIIVTDDVPPGTVDVSPRNRIRILSFKGAPPRDITVRNARELASLTCLPSGAGFFSVDRRNLLFITPDGTSRVLWSPVGIEPLWAVPAPDGRHLAISVGSGQTNAWMLTNF